MPDIRATTACQLLVCVLSVLAISSCVQSYPYLVLNDECRCENYHYRDPRLGIEIHLAASYRVKDVVTSTIEITFVNDSGDTLTLKQGFIKATSLNVRYANNDMFQPLPFVDVQPGKRFVMTIEGRDTDQSSDPWLKIAGERVTIELKRLRLGSRDIPPLLFRLMPVNPQFSL
ncbi:MAG TPA: hypothetical protein VNN76_10120 [Bacteroidota bacterium]|nr:hypothetical protein [Bacteroidota bacterium]